MRRYSGGWPAGDCLGWTGPITASLVTVNLGEIWKCPPPNAGTFFIVIGALLLQNTVLVFDTNVGIAIFYFVSRIAALLSE